MGRKKKDREARRVTLYIDAEIHDEIQALAERFDMSLSHLTRLLYVATLSMGKLIEEVAQHEREFEELYPHGVPEEEQAAFAQDLAHRWERIIDRWGNYVNGLAAGAGLPNVDVGAARATTPEEFFATITEKLEGVKKLEKLLEEGQTTPAERQDE